ncbi:UDP-glucuronosyltransferase 1-6-like [Trichoplusia ni]|uniref:UDP-glucuronosyltransferase 1-6-like n=1 Tax=Trichoplusia ni TaxID=7111 RepID=A0A7E5W5B1_TRINI|nr:UDP-glucuronosyltransferase 1-6-like [Trichoplusia ni]
MYTFFFLCYYVLFICEAYKILVVYPMPAISHKILGDGIVRPLLKSGHEVTYITPYEYKDPPSKLRQIDVSSNSKLIPPDITINLHQILNGEMTPADRMDLVDIMRAIAVETLENRNVQNLLKDPKEQFDVVIVEWMHVSLMSGQWVEGRYGVLTYRLTQMLTGHGAFGHYLFRVARREVTTVCHQCGDADDTALHTLAACPVFAEPRAELVSALGGVDVAELSAKKRVIVILYFSLAALFGCPLIWMSPVETHSGIISLIDAAPNPAYSTDSLSKTLPPFTFNQRVAELWRRITERFEDYVYFDDLEELEYYRLIVPHILTRGRLPSAYEDVRYNISLVLSISRVPLGLGSLPQKYKPLGGYFINEEVAPLSEELKLIMDSNKNGVIYFSMGTNLDTKDLPGNIKIGLLKVFGDLKQTVLWKMEEDLPNLPANVHIMKWAPQMSILSHPNCILFISHGGLLSLIEAIHTTIPVIGIPVYGDQFVNIKRAVTEGYALEVDLSHSLAEDLKVAIQKMLHDIRYMKRIKEISLIFHDRPMKAADELVYWVEHVVRTRGAPHLRSPALLVPLYQRLYLDLVALVAFAVGLFVRLLRRICFRKKKDVKKKNQ